VRTEQAQAAALENLALALDHGGYNVFQCDHQGWWSASEHSTSRVYGNAPGRAARLLRYWSEQLRRRRELTPQERRSGSFAL